MSSSSAKPRRTIKEVSHLFLSSTSSDLETSTFQPIIGCYITKGIKEESAPIRSVLRLLRTGPNPIRIFYLDTSSLAVKSSPEFEAAPVSNNVFADLEIPDERFTPPFGISSEFYLFVFREDDCVCLDTLFSCINHFLIISPSKGRDLTEVYKFIKAVVSTNNKAHWFLCIYPEDEASVSQSLSGEFNKVTERLLNVSVQFLHSETPVPLRQWQQVIKEKGSEFIELQKRILRRISERI